jgi:hypothetical protein
MELLPTLRTCVGMLWYGSEPEERKSNLARDVPEGWTLLSHDEFETLTSAIQAAKESADESGRFLPDRNWGIVPQLLIKAFTNRHLRLVDRFPPTAIKITTNFLEIVKPIEIETIKSVIKHRERLDIEQAVAFVLRLIPEHSDQLIPLIPTIITQSCMWLEQPLPVRPETDTYRREHLRLLLQYAEVEVSGSTWEELFSILFRIRRNRPADASCALRLPKWIQAYYSGDPKDLAWAENQYPMQIIENPIILGKTRFNRIARYVWRLLPNAPAKVLRRDIEALSKRLLYAEDSGKAISETSDRVALAYTFLAIQRRLQLKIVSDLHGQFLGKGESRQFQQNTPHVQTSFEERLAEIAISRENIDWAVLTAVQKPKGFEMVESVDELVGLVDTVCGIFERYVAIHGRGHTETLRCQPGRRGGFRGPVDDWNAAVDILVELRRRINDAGYQFVSKPVDDTVQEDDFMIVGQVEDDTMEKQLELPKADKFLALDIMSWNKSWGDDAFALAKMPPQWWIWLQKRRSEGKCSMPESTIVID